MFEAWATHVTLTVTGRDSAQTNYPTRVDVTFRAGMQADFDDVRFSNAADTVALKFWRASYVPSTSAVFYVVIPSLPASGGSTTIRLHFGNNSATYAGEPLGANGLFLDFDGGTHPPLPRSPGTHLIEAGAPGAWDDSYIASDGAFVKNLDGSLYVDADGYGWGTYNGSNQARRAMIDIIAPYDGDNAPGDDCPGFFKFLASDPENTVEKVSISDPFLKWGSGTWDPFSGTIWDGRVVQQGHIFCDAEGELVAPGTFICFVDGDAGPANVKEAYRQGVALGVGANPGAAVWTKKQTGNPSGQPWTFQHSYLNVAGHDDTIAYAGGFIYEGNEAWSQFYTGHRGGGGGWGVMRADGARYYGGWARYQSTWVWQPRPDTGGFEGWVDWVMKVRGIYYLGYVLLGHDTDTDGRRKWAFYVGRSADKGATWTLDGEYFNRSTNPGDWDYGRLQGADVVWNHVTGKMMQHYTASSIGNGAYGDTPAYVPPLKIAVTQWTATPPFLANEPTVTESIGRSVAFNYGVTGAVGRSVGLTYVVRAPVGRSLQIPYGIETTGYRTFRLLIPAPVGYATRRTLLDTLTPQGPFTAKGSSRRHATAGGGSRRHARISGGPTP